MSLLDPFDDSLILINDRDQRVPLFNDTWYFIMSSSFIDPASILAGIKADYFQS